MARIRVSAVLLNASRASSGSVVASTSRAVAPAPRRCAHQRFLSLSRRLRAPVDRPETLHLPTDSYTTSVMTDDEYHDVSDTTMDAMTDYLESMIEDGGPQLRGCDVDYSSGVLTLNMAGHGIYVINKQPPNKQIWLSSPISGPKRYDFDDKKQVWFNARDGTKLQDLLNAELSPMADQEVRVDVGLDG